MASARNAADRSWPAGATTALPGITPPQASTRGGCSATAGLATCPRRSRYPSFGGPQAVRSFGNPLAESPDRPDKRHGNAHKGRAGGRDKPGGHGKDNPGEGEDKEVARRLW
jgi:hypothetical protein